MKKPAPGGKKNKKRRTPPDLTDSVGDEKKGRRGAYLLETGIGKNPADTGATGEGGLSELATEERLRAEDTDRADVLRSTSDMRDLGNKDAGDDGLPGGLGAGEAEEISPEFEPEDLAGMGGAGTVDGAGEAPPRKRRGRSPKKKPAA